MIKIYGIKNCNTMKKTFEIFDSEEIAYVFHDYKKEKPSEDLLEKFVKKSDLSSIINKKGTTYRKLTEEEKLKMESLNTAIPLLIEKSSMIKRPIIEDKKGGLIIGYDEEKIKQL